jgi:predicted Zn-dependent peptidase
VRNEVLEPALAAVFAELDRIATQPVPAGELDDVKNYLTGHFVLSLESQNGLANRLNMVKVDGLPNDYLEKYTSRIRAVQPGEIQAAAERYMAKEKAAVIVVGDGTQIAKSLEKFGKVQVNKATP